jgi:hypothetical protein
VEKPVILSRDQLGDWDDFVQTHPFGWLCHLSSWQQVLACCVRINICYFLAIVDESSGRIVAGLPVYQTKSLTLDKRLNSAPLTTIFDPLVSNQEQLSILLFQALSLLKFTGSSKLIIKTLRTSSLWPRTEAFKDNSFRYHYLDLGKDLDMLWKQAHRSCIRQHINKAVQKGVKVRLAENKNDLRSFYQLYSSTRKRHGLPAIPYIYFETIWDIYQPLNFAYFLLAEYEHSVISFLMAFKFKDNFSAEALGWDDHFRWLTPSAITFWEAIKLAKQLGCRQFDFGRTASNNENLIRFKRHWGSEEIEMPQYIFRSGEKSSHRNLPDSLIRNSGLTALIKCCPDSFYKLFSRFYYQNFAG